MEIIKKIKTFLGIIPEEVIIVKKGEPIQRKLTDDYFSFDTVEDEKRFLLEKTASAHNDAFIINYLKNVVLLSEIEKKGPIKKTINKYEIKEMQKIYEFLCESAPNIYFWEIAIDKIMSDMVSNKFELQPSMNRIGREDQIDNLSLESQKKLECYENISLVKHLLNTIETYMEEYKDKLEKFSFPTFDVLLACLMHDFGKSKKLIKNLHHIDIDYMRHEMISGLYIDSLQKKVEEIYIFDKGERDDEFQLSIALLERVKKAVVEHHKDNVAKGSLSDLIKHIDHKTREREYKEYDKKTRRK